MRFASSDSSYFRVDKRKEFGTKKCAILATKKNTIVKNIDIKLLSFEV